MEENRHLEGFPGRTHTQTIEKAEKAVYGANMKPLEAFNNRNQMFCPLEQGTQGLYNKS